MPYKGDHHILVAVDSIIFGMKDNTLHLLLFKREIDPLAGEWSLIGQFVDKDEDVNFAAKRILKELTGLANIYMEQLHCFGNKDRDPGGRVISIAYWSLIKVDITDLDIRIKDHQAKWIPLKSLPSLVLDHSDMVSKAITRIRERARFYPIGFELLPLEFTIPQLLKVYEAILAIEIDDRNFRKRILKSGLLTKLGKKDMTTSKKGSFLYAFNEKRYKELEKTGFSFDFGF